MVFQIWNFQLVLLAVNLVPRVVALQPAWSVEVIMLWIHLLRNAHVSFNSKIFAYFLIKISILLACPGGCESGQCTFSSTTNKAACGKCLKGYVRHTDATCKGCPGNCDTCKYENSRTICTTCSAKHYHVQSKMCIACPPGCNSCTYSSNMVKCLSSGCSSGYVYYNGKCHSKSDH